MSSSVTPKLNIYLVCTRNTLYVVFLYIHISLNHSSPLEYVYKNELHTINQKALFTISICDLAKNVVPCDVF